MNAPPVPAPPTASELNEAISRAQRAILEAQQGARWNGSASLEPICTAHTLLVRAWVGEPSPNAVSLARGLIARQLPDGSFAPYPYAARGDTDDEVCATATVWAALAVVPGVPESAAAIEKARAFVEAHGGTATVVSGLVKLNFAALFAAMGGVVDPAELPDVSGLLALLPSFLRNRLGTRLTIYAMEATLMVASIIGHLKDRHGLLRWIEDHRALELVREFQNKPGGWDGETTQTALMLAFYHAAGVPHDDPGFTHALAWLRSMEMPTDPAGGPPTWVSEFDGGVWCTSFAVRALLESGVSRRHPRVEAAIGWLLGGQVEADQPRVDNLHAGAPRVGGWAFQRANRTMPDCDDTGVALMALGLALEPDGDDSVAPALVEQLRTKIDKGDAWLRGMQDDCGGWAAFAWGFREKPPGEIMETAPDTGGFGLGAMVRMFLDPPWLLQDPATEGLTGRVLMGLARIGYRKGDPAVDEAIAFLQRQQCKNEKGEGYGWWGRWEVNYLAATSFVLQGLAAVGEDMKAPWIQQAVAWIKDRQNDDGGWGEGVDSYTHPERAGQAPSMEPLTGLVLSALIPAGEADSLTVLRGVRYLLGCQLPNGLWHDDRWLHVYFPPSLFYVLPSEGHFHSLGALALYARARGVLAPRAGASGAGAPRLSDGSWSPAYLEAMRQVADPEADGVVAQVYEEGHLDAVNKLFATIVRNDDPIPPGLPKAAQDYFERTAALPAWADRGKILTAQKLFTRLGWSATAGLYCCALPRAYGAARGARVLLLTGGMTYHTLWRVFETAQFIFDVMDEGGLEPEGRGVRAAQKVRLLHAAIRHLTHAKGGWDAAADGEPINQEDEVGTLMTFSWAILYTWQRFGVDVTTEEGEAWMHAWNVVGALMGIREELLPKDAPDGRALSDAIMASQWESSAAGRALAQALVGAVDRLLPPPFAGYLPTLIRYIAGDLCADLLGLPQADWTSRMIAGAVDLTDVADDDLDGRFGKIFHAVAHAMMKGIVTVVREGKHTRFRIPPALIHAWNLHD